MRHEHLAEVYLRLGDLAEAEKIGPASDIEAAGQVYPLATLVSVLSPRPRSRKPATNSKSFARWRAAPISISRRSSGLKPLVKEWKLPEDWRTPKTPTDVGKRPDLATLGPLCWHPSPAAGWSLPQPDGTQISLDHYRGKPVLVLFYLGSGCLHCVEQLRKFSPMAADFSREGISIVAISSEPMDSLKHSLTTLEGQRNDQFSAHCATADQKVFRAYRAYDDFENMPLHGAFLIDAAGLVRWHDIGYEPFMDASFVLNEARRLLHH